MGKMKSIRLTDDGPILKTDYEGFKKQISYINVSLVKRNDWLEKYFPQEFLIEKEQKSIITNNHRWNRWLFPEKSPEEHLHLNNNSKILSRAKNSIHKKYIGEHRNNVTSFSSWIFDLDHRWANLSSLQEGKVGEKIIQQQKFERCFNVKSPSILNNEWELLWYDDFTKNKPSLPISLLTVNGKPMLGRPDYIFLNNNDKTIIIVEVKVSNKQLPEDGWANLRAQLWAYSHIDLVLENAKKVILIGEVWVPTQNQMYYPRKTYRWDQTNDKFCAENEELFAYYQKYASN